MRPSLTLFIITNLALAACSEPTVLLLQVKARDSVPPAAALWVRFENGGNSFENTFRPKDNSSIFAPEESTMANLVILTDGRTGTTILDVEALDETGNVLGRGQTNITIFPNKQTTAQATLDPLDFQVNGDEANDYNDDQIFSTGASGRQLASDDQGNFVVVWENFQCASTC
ncbi:MAG: hypothetical protein V1754_00300, partial [Pseudomonadota bacterium]